MNESSQQTLEQFHRQFDEVYTFNAADECFDFVTDIESQKVFLIISALEGEQLVPLIHALPQLYAIYIICSDGERVHGEWTKEWSKIIDVYSEITSICKVVPGDVKQYNQNSIPMSFMQQEENNFTTHLNQLEPSFNRGQGLSTSDFEKLKKTQHGLMSFNSFLSASYDMEVSLLLAQSSADKFDTIGILFVIVIDPELSSTPFADIRNVSYFEQEREVLFSMHTVFRIGQIKTMDKQGRLVEVHLTLTADDDPQLRKLSDRLQTEIEDLTGLERVGNLLYSV